MKSENKARSHH